MQSDPKNATAVRFRLGLRVASGAGALLLCALFIPLAVSAQGERDLGRYPLEPPDISSPEATLNTFLSEATAAVEAYHAGDRVEMEARAHRMFQTMDLPRPENDAAFLRATESALYLIELLARVDIPAPRAIPGPDLEPEQMTRSWRIPHTELVIQRIDSESGDPIGYRFSSETIERLPEFYQRAAGLPPKKRFAAYEGIAERFRLRPGFQAPAFLQVAVQSLPPVWFETFAGEPWWKWVAVISTILGGFLVVLLLFRLSAPLDDRGKNTAGLRTLVRPLVLIAAVGVVAFLHEVTVSWIRPTGAEREIVIGLLSVLTHAVLIWLVFVLMARFADALIRGREMGAHALDAQLVRLVSKLVAVLVAIYILVHLTESLGIPVAPVIAGLGVGGLAVALAVRPTLENVIGGFVLFGDAPVRVGEFCKFGDQLGTVEAIGLRSVQVRGLDRTVITVPNADFAQLQLINFSRRDMNLYLKTLELVHETTPDQLRLVLARLRELLIAHPRIAPDPARVRFVGYGASSLDVEIFAFVETRDWNEFLAIQEDLNLRIKELVEQCGTSFAFPSRTVYLAPSEGIDPEQTKAAED